MKATRSVHACSPIGHKGTRAARPKAQTYRRFRQPFANYLFLTASSLTALTLEVPSSNSPWRIIAISLIVLTRRQLDSGTISRLNYRSFPRTTVIDPAGSLYMPSGVAAIVMFLSSAGVLQYCTRATDPMKGWLMCLASSMTR